MKRVFFFRSWFGDGIVSLILKTISSFFFTFSDFFFYLWVDLFLYLENKCYWFVNINALPFFN